MNSSERVVVSGGFDDIRSHDLRFLEEAAKLGRLSALLWPDALILERTGQAPKFPYAERLYFLNAVRYVDRVLEGDAGSFTDPGAFTVWVEQESQVRDGHEKLACELGLDYRVILDEALQGFPAPPPMPPEANRKRVIATGCFDWFHSGHVRFTEQASEFGDLYLCVGNDANIRFLKGEGHPLLSEDERRYVVGSIKFVKEALITSGTGWMDADPEIRRLKPDIYVVNEDGDKGGKREYCQELGIEYLVLERTPAAGLPKRSSTDLRGF